LPDTLPTSPTSLAPWVLAAALLSCGSQTTCSRVGGSAAPAVVAAESPAPAALGSVAKGGAGDRPIVAPEHAQGLVQGAVRWVGRVDASDPNAVKFAWSGTGFLAVVSGTKISVRLETQDADAAFFQPVVDGKPGPRFQVRGGTARTVTIGEDLRDGDHTVELYRETEGMFGHSVFGGFVDGALRGAPQGNGRLIEVIGDSISAGYGNLGNEVHPPWDNSCSFSVDTESAYQAYGAMIGRALDAEVSVVARSGWGIYRDGGGNTANVLAKIYGGSTPAEGSAAWDFKRKADAVIINLGTNDDGKGDPGTPYETAYVAFVRTVRSHYPDAWIFLTLGPMTGDPQLGPMRAHVSHVASAVADPKVVVVEMPSQDATSTGCDYHPNVAEHEKMAHVLTKAIQAKLGW
jgi:lysophospholipase L1-like esterase